MSGPIHLTGPYRSGSTFAALLLGNHPAFPQGPGLHTTNWPRERHETVSDALDYARDRWDLTPAADPFALDIDPRGTTYDGCRWDATMRALGYGDRWMEKTNLEVGFQPTFLDWFPNGHALTVIRDPRSVVASFREYTYHDGPTYLQATFVALATLQMAREHEQRLPADRYRTIRYETLALHPEHTLREVTDWLGLDWPGADVMLDTSGWRDVAGVAWEDRSSFSDPSEIEVEQAVYRWKGHLSSEELQFVEWICWDALQDFGYETSRSVRPYPLPFSGFLREARTDPGVDRMLERWLDTGKGTEAFPDDPLDASTWRDSNRESVA